MAILISIADKRNKNDFYNFRFLIIYMRQFILGQRISFQMQVIFCFRHRAVHPVKKCTSSSCTRNNKTQQFQ